MEIFTEMKRYYIWFSLIYKWLLIGAEGRLCYAFKVFSKEMSV